ncbi:MAG TPA: hypothetical protein VN829_04455 [Dongiaceae bacterium]|nr:hypothetical protein [Dongiaceae bacterium]
MNIETFLALRRDALIIAADREFRGSTEPIPELPAVPGIYRPTPKPEPFRARTKGAPVSHKEANRRWSAARRSRQARGTLPVGTPIEMGRGMGTIIGYVAPGEDPMAYVPAGTKTGHITGCRRHEANNVPRYAVTVLLNGELHYYFPKSAWVERFVDPITMKRVS